MNKPPVINIAVFTVALLFITCNAGRKKDTQSQQNRCNCNLTQEEMSSNSKLPLSISNDSIIICKPGTTTIFDSRSPLDKKPVDWTTLLLEHRFTYDYTYTGNLTDCSTGKELKTSFKGYYVIYDGKKIITESYFHYDSLRKDGTWLERPPVRAYKEEFLAKNGKFIKTDPEMILVPPVYNKEAIAKIHESYKIASLSSDRFKNNYFLHKQLLVAALNGDSLSRSVLLKYTPDPQSDNSLSFYIKILKDYEVLKRPRKFR